MNASIAAKVWIEYHTTHSKKKYRPIVSGHHRAVLPGIR